MENEAEVSDRSPLFAVVNTNQFIQVVAIGVVVGALTWVLAHVLGLYVLKPSNCTAQALACAASSQPANILAALLAACIGLFGLVKLQVFRPLLIVLAATMSAWGLVGELAALPWYGSLLVTVFFFALTYTTFMWISRIRTFWLVLIITVVLVVALRLIITA